MTETNAIKDVEEVVNSLRILRGLMSSNPYSRDDGRRTDVSFTHPMADGLPTKGHKEYKIEVASDGNKERMWKLARGRCKKKDVDVPVVAYRNKKGVWMCRWRADGGYEQASLEEFNLRLLTIEDRKILGEKKASAADRREMEDAKQEIMSLLSKETEGLVYVIDTTPLADPWPSASDLVLAHPAKRGTPARGHKRYMIVVALPRRQIDRSAYWRRACSLCVAKGVDVPVLAYKYKGEGADIPWTCWWPVRKPPPGRYPRGIHFPLGCPEGLAVRNSMLSKFVKKLNQMEKRK